MPAGEYSAWTKASWLEYALSPSSIFSTDVMPDFFPALPHDGLQPRSLVLFNIPQSLISETTRASARSRIVYRLKG